MKRPSVTLLFALAIALAIAALALWFGSPTPVALPATSVVPPFPPSTPLAGSAPLAPRHRASSPAVALATPEPSPLAAELNAPASAAARDVEIVQLLLHQYLRRLHQLQGPPIGDDIDLARALTGKNPIRLALLPADHPAITPDGHLRDRWGSPYFIHAQGHGVFEIRSAGPDRKLFTEDDIVASPK